MESFSYDRSGYEGVDLEKLRLAENFLQAFYAKRRLVGHDEVGEDQAIAEEIGKFGGEFRKWLDTEGHSDLERYTREHSFAEIGNFADMDGLIEKYETHHSKMIH